MLLAEIRNWVTGESYCIIFYLILEWVILDSPLIEYGGVGLGAEVFNPALGDEFISDEYKHVACLN